MEVEIKVELIKNVGFAFPRLETAGPVTNHIDGQGYRITTGIGDDLMLAARDAVSAMIDWICATTQMFAVYAYMLCSVVGDLRISEIVDAPTGWSAFIFQSQSWPRSDQNGA